MKYKYLIIIIIPFFFSCEFSIKKEKSSEKKYRKIKNELISIKKDDPFGLKEGSKAYDLNSKGIKLGINQKYEEAEKIFKKALLEEPSNPMLLNNIGLTYYSRGIYNTAIDYFSQALKISDSTSVMAATNLGLTYYQQMDYARAMKIMNFTLTKQKTDNAEKLLVRLNRLMVNLELEDCQEIKADRALIEYLRFNNEAGDYPNQIEEFDNQIAKLCTTSVHRK